MPEYLSPGVYVEETSFRSKTIEGVSTSTLGLLGQTSFGPITGRPDVVVSFPEFMRRYGGVEDIVYAGGASTRINFSAHAARAFFDNGGKRLYVARVFKPADASAYSGQAALNLPQVGGDDVLKVRARYPGSWGNRYRVEIGYAPGRWRANILDTTKASPVIRGVYDGAVVQTRATVPASAAALADPSTDANVYQVKYVSGSPVLYKGGTTLDLTTVQFAAIVEMVVNVFTDPAARAPAFTYASLSPGQLSNRFIGSFFDELQPGDPDAPIIMSPGLAANVADPLKVMSYLTGTPALPSTTTLEGGNDGAAPSDTDYEGLDDEFQPKGIAALGHLDDIALVIAPDAAAAALAGADSDHSFHQSVNNVVIAHCENERYRFAVLDEPLKLKSGAALAFRSKFATSYAGIYYPGVIIPDPRQGQDGKKLTVSPSGFVAGVCARTDIRRGVWKAPANESVFNALDFEFHITKGVQDVLNPRGVNCLRFFEEGGFRVWGARTMSADPEWKYVNVRRLFIYLEHSIDKGTQWVVFEPNNEATWLNVRHTIEDFLFNVFKQGALMGTKKEEAFFVKCDRSTMTQNDLDNGRLVCQVGVSPAYPAEFVIFRIGQWTADAKSA